MKKIYSKPGLKVADLELTQIICESITISNGGSAQQSYGMDARRRGLFWDNDDIETDFDEE